MKLLALLLLTCSCFADSINYQTIQIDGSNPGTVTNYDLTQPLLCAYGFTPTGGYYYFGANGNPLLQSGYLTGYLDVYANGLTIQGNLEHISFNPNSGQFQAAFIGKIVDDGVTTHVFHAILYETVNLKTMSVQSGYLTVKTVVPEPSTIPLALLGLGALAFTRKLHARG